MGGMPALCDHAWTHNHVLAPPEAVGLQHSFLYLAQNCQTVFLITHIGNYNSFTFLCSASTSVSKTEHKGIYLHALS